MQVDNLFLLFTEPLGRLGLQYMVTGSVAGIIYGEPRMTHDVDLVVLLGKTDPEELVGAFPLEEFYCPPAEIIAVEARRSMRGHFNIIHHETGFKADIYTQGRDPLHRWGMARRRQLSLSGKALWLAPPEYVIVRKLEYYREGRSEKHLTDVVGILRHSAISEQDLQGWLDDRALAAEWEEVDRRWSETP